MPDPSDAEPTAPKVYEQPALPPHVLDDNQLKAMLEACERAKNGGAPTPFAEIGEPRKRAFLVALALCGSKFRASKVAGLSHFLIYTTGWREDQQFQKAVAVAQLMAIDVAEEEARRRAVEGWVDPTGWYKGEPGGYVRRYSDILLMFYLKGAMPDKYKDRMEVRGFMANVDLDRLTQAQLARLAAGESAISVLGSAGDALPTPALPAPADGDGKPELGTIEDDSS